MPSHVIELPPAVEALKLRADADPVERLQEKLLDLQEAAQVIQAKADADDRDLTEDEQKELDGIFAEFEDVEAQIEYRNRIEEKRAKLNATLGRKVKPEPSDDEPHAARPVRRADGHRVAINDGASRGSWGFRSFGEFAAAVRYGVRGNVDPRLIANAPSTYSTEGVGADGGFAVPPDFRQAIMEQVMAETSLLSRCDVMNTTSNSVTIPTDETTAWQSTGGVQAYWEGEASQYSQSKLALQNVTVRLNKLTALVPVSEELLDDAPTLDGYLRRKVPAKFDFAVNLALIQGNGVGRPLGLLNSDALVTVAKETSQTADTINYDNIVKMWSRMYGPSRANAVWLINQDIETQLMKLSFEGTSSSVPAYMPAGGLSASPYGTLMGRPVIPTQACETLGDKGDIILADMSKYLAVIKTGGIRSDVSMHLWFDYDTVAYRFTFRVAGQPWLSGPISPRDGSNTLSPFVTLAERG